MKIIRENIENNTFFFFFLYFPLFIHLFILGCIGSSLLSAGFSLVVASWGYSSLRCLGFSLQWLLLLQSTGSRHMRSVVAARGLWSAGLVAPWHVGSSRTRAQTLVPCTGRRILNHCATREAQNNTFYNWY